MTKIQTRFVCQNCGTVLPRARWGAARSAAPGTAWSKRWSPSPTAPAHRCTRAAGLGGRSSRAGWRRSRRCRGAPAAADRRVCPRAGRRGGARLDRAGRRRPGHRQIHPDAAGGAGNGARAYRCCMSRARNRSARSRCAPLRLIRRRGQAPCPRSSSWSPRPTWR